MSARRLLILGFLLGAVSAPALVSAETCFGFNHQPANDSDELIYGTSIGEVLGGHGGSDRIQAYGGTDYV